MVTINSLKNLVEEHQPGADSGRCVLLHEFAHALHDRQFGEDHEGIRGMYEQAMERKLYPKEMYAAANDREFFAEMTCAYLDRLHDFPHTRRELEKHDPATYKVMAKLWGGLSNELRGHLSTDGDGHKTFRWDLSPNRMNITDDLHGPKWNPLEYRNKPVLLISWIPEQASSIALFPRLLKWHGEFGRHGLKTQLASHFIVDPAVAKRTAEQHNLPFGVSGEIGARRADECD